MGNKISHISFYKSHASFCEPLTFRFADYKSLKSDEDEKWEERRQKAGELELKVTNGVVKYTMEDIDELVAIGKHNEELKNKQVPRMNELNDAEVEVDVKPIKEADFIKAIKLNDQSIGVMDELDFMIEE